MTDARPDATSRKVLRPRDAATLIIVDTASGEPRVLLGRRRGDLAFMPGRYVFPGGRVDPSDRLIAVEADDLAPGNIERLMVDMKGNRSPARARALALAAVRETFEEAGLLIGVQGAPASRPKAEAWQRFFSHGYRPALAKLTFFARAITPPGRPRRYDTRFFCVAAEAIVHRVATDGELSDLEWHSIEQARTLDLPNITRVVLEDLGERIAAGALHKSDVPVPFYHRRNRNFHRDLIDHEALAGTRLYTA
jgi:8-oxo-dGTP pyrophosphatase MutT (NUDIX family)